MTPALVATEITSLIGNAFNAHITNYNNPHRVTAAQVGLGNVQNYPMASVADAQAGTNNAELMSPYLTAAAISFQALTPLNAHINNTSNPHQVTQAQVGLGLVQNYGVASTAQAQAGTANNVYMTPALTAAAITSQIGNAFNAHITNYSNPHQTTAAQVGLGNVNNTSDLNKPISTATQNALNTKATSGTDVRFNSVGVGNDGYVLLYEYTTGGFAVRTGAGNYTYLTLDTGGNLSVGGEMVASNGFQVSDERLKSNPQATEARELWKDLEYVHWHWNEKSPLHGKYDRGVISQRVMEKYKEYITTFNWMLEPGDPALGIEATMSEDYYAVNYSDMAFEMSIAAGRKVDRVDDRVTQLEQRVQQLESLLQSQGG
jgi:hypothetical protein